ncbi:MAG TPA: hypothetical protein VF086_08360 [Propionibacteriaceae bacterium]
MTVFTSYDTPAISSGRTPHAWTHLMATTKNRSRCHSPAERLPNMPTG